MGTERRYGTLIPHGEGGMATVYQGYDAQLGRHVALKFLHRDDPLWQQRLLREARLQARLHHPGICRVYDVGTAPDGRLYIAMEWIDGEELDAVARHLPLSARLDLIRQTASAVGAAHAAGLLHRDLKPSNILVRRPPADAEEHPASDVAVVDFGLAWSMAAQPLTQQGTLLGTPSYAAPELLRGMRTLWGPTLDVYGLGATLFHLIAGRPPFEGEELVHVMHAVLRDPAPDVREFAPETPHALASVVARCLEKAPTLRYPTMAALAADLTRAERAARAPRPRGARAVAMRSGAAVQHAARRLRRTPWLMAMMMAVIALTLVIAIQLRREETRLADARRYQALAGDWERALRAARLGQPGGLITAKADVRRRMAALEAPADDARRGWAAAALGRGYLALGDVDRAAIALARAWDAGMRSPQTALAYALALGRRFADRLDAIGPDERSHRAQITSLLRWVDARANDTSLVADRPVADYVPALLAYYDQRYDEAHRRAAQMTARYPWFYEARLLGADALLARALREEDRGDIAAMRASQQAARAAYVGAAAIASGAPEPWIGQCAVARGQLRAFAEHGAAGTAVDLAQLTRWRDAARSDCRTALRHDPESIDAYAYEASAMWEWARGTYDFARRDARPALRMEIDRLDEALRQHPQAGRLYTLRADLHWLIGRRATQIDRADPRAFYQQAVRDYRRALRTEPDRALIFYLLAQVHARQLEYEAARGLPIAPTWQLALRSLLRAEALVQARPTPELERAWIGQRRAHIHWTVAFGRYRRGLDFGDHAAHLFATCRRALAQGGASGSRLRWMGNAYTLRAYHHAIQNRDADAALAYRQAMAYQARASRLTDGGLAGIATLLMAQVATVNHDLTRGVDPLALLLRADHTLATFDARTQGGGDYIRTVAAWLRLELAIEQLRRRFAGFAGDPRADAAPADDRRDRAAEAAALARFARPDYAGEPRHEATFYLLWRVWEAQARGEDAAATRLLEAAMRMQQRMLARGGDPQVATLQRGAMAVLRARAARDPLARDRYLDEAAATWRAAQMENRWLMQEIPFWQRMADALRDPPADRRMAPVG